MSKTDDGGPAFPGVETRHGKSEGTPEWFRVFSAGGMTLRDYFATHAPSEPASWFVPKGIDRPAWSERGPKLPHGTTAVVGHCDACDAYFEASAKFEADQERRRSDYYLAQSAQ